MPVTTRYQRAARLYESVLEQPLLLHEIINHLSSADIVRLKMTGGGLCREDRFIDTVNLCLKKRHVQYLELKEKEKCDKFCLDVRKLLTKTEQARGTANKIRHMNVLYDYLVDNRWFVEMAYFKKLVDVVESKIIETIMSHPDDYLPFGLHYMEALFGIQMQLRVDEDTGELVEYITTRSGEVLSWSGWAV